MTIAQTRKELEQALAEVKSYEATPFYPLFEEYKRLAHEDYYITFYGFMLRIKDNAEYIANVPHLKLDETVSRTKTPVKLDLDSVKGILMRSSWHKEFWEARGWVIEREIKDD